MKVFTRGRIGLALAVAVLLAWGLGRLRFETDALSLLPGDIPAVRALQLQQRHFSTAHQLFLTLRGDDPELLAEQVDAIAHRLRTRTDLARSVLARPPWLERPADGAENLAWLWLQQSPADFAALGNRLQSPALERQFTIVRETLSTSLDPGALGRASTDPLNLSQLPGGAGPAGGGWDSGVGTFQNTAGTFRVIQVEPPVDALPYREAERWLAAIRTEIQSIPGAPAVQFTGGPAFLSEIAGGMERDLTNSVLTTLVVISLLFWLAHRSLRPLLGLVAALALTLLGTLALGGLWFGTLNVLSAGFAAVLLGLVVDYGLVGYQEARAHPDLSLPELRRRVGPGIGWSAVTTAGTFAMLRWAGLPGLAELGTLTALGLLLGAVVMIYGFLPLAVGRGPRGDASGHPAHTTLPRPTGRLVRRGLALTGALLVIATAILATRGWPTTTSATEPLRPRNSLAHAAMAEMREQLGQTNDPIGVLVRGDSAAAVGRSLAAVESELRDAVGRGELTSYVLPAGFWPHPEQAKINFPAAAALAATRPTLHRVALNAGFTTNSLQLTDLVFQKWSEWGTAATPTAPLWPTNATATWLHRQFAAQDAGGHWLALGWALPGDRPWAPRQLPPETLLGGWNRLGPALLERVAGRVQWLTALIILVIAGSLWLAFRRWIEVALGLAALAAALGLLLAVLSATGTSWNLLSLVAIPLVLGSSVDSTIHVQLALRRGGGWRELWRSTGRALVLCAGANVAGFGSLAWSNNAGLASLDLVCAGGVLCVLLVALGLLPTWWWAATGAANPPAGPPGDRTPPTTEISTPSGLYRPWVWRCGGWLAARLPRPAAVGLARGLIRIYQTCLPARRRMVVENLRPLSDGTNADAERLARENFAQFAAKLTDLCRFEAGVTPRGFVRPGSGWDHLAGAQSAGRGALLVTPHLGNWELGAQLLLERGIRPLVLTAAEPGAGFTELRAAARSRRDIETLVVGADPFAFVRVIQHLQAGGVVAVLVDRPAPATAALVELFGRPFAASLAAAELARATGCAVLPTYIIHDDDGYVAHFLPPVPYERRALSDRAARTAFTGAILRAFEPVLRQHSDQWFHFVPLWPSPSRPPSVG